jgi:hypothetical protein
MSVEQPHGSWAGLLRHRLRREPACDACMAASADGPPDAALPDSGTAGQAATKRRPFVLLGDSVTEQADASATAMNPRRSDVS